MLPTPSARFRSPLRSAAVVALALGAFACHAGPAGATGSESGSEDAEPAAVAAGSAADASAPRTYFAYDDAEVGDVIDTIARIAGANIVVAPEVVGKVSLRCRNVPWRDALDAAVQQVGARVTELDRGMLQVLPVTADSSPRMQARAVEIRNTSPPQVCVDVRIADEDEIIQVPQFIVLEGQEGRAFVGDADASGAETGLTVAVAVGGGIATLELAKLERGVTVHSERAAVAVQR